MLLGKIIKIKKKLKQECTWCCGNPSKQVGTQAQKHLTNTNQSTVMKIKPLVRWFLSLKTKLKSYGYNYGNKETFDSCPFGLSFCSIETFSLIMMAQDGQACVHLTHNVPVCLSNILLNKLNHCSESKGLANYVHLSIKEIHLNIQCRTHSKSNWYTNLYLNTARKFPDIFLKPVLVIFWPLGGSKNKL